MGAGRFGVVYRARDNVPERQVALKLPRPALVLSRETRQLFKREARLVARLDHRGVIHRYLKPSNILLEPPNSGRSDDRPRPRVTDFGLAIPLSDNQGDRSIQKRVETLPYMAPEIRDDRAVSTVSSDIYAMGVILFPLLTGRSPGANQPIDGPPVYSAKIHKMNSGMRGSWHPTLPELRIHRSGVARDLEAVVAKCLAEPPDSRYGSAAELAVDLGRYLDGHSVQ